MKNGEWDTNPQYNKTRGTGFFQDRADLTLLDIKNCFTKEDGSWLLKQYNSRPNMKKWLDHFGTGMEGFQTYADFFCFESTFLEEYRAKDLQDGELINSINDDKYKRKFSDYSPEELERVLSNTNEWIKKRSKIMEGIINREFS